MVYSRRVALLKRGLQIVEGDVRPLGERDRLLDLERDRDAAVVGAVVVLDRDQIEEADQLLGAAGLLLGREGRGSEGVDRCHGSVAGRLVGDTVAAGGGHRDRVELAVGSGLRGLTALLRKVGERMRQ